MTIIEQLRKERDEYIVKHTWNITIYTTEF